MAREWRTAVLTHVEDSTPGNKRFFFTVKEEGTFEFKAGQFVTFDLPIDDKVRLRSYSIASAPADGNEFELIVVRVPDGKGTGYLFSDVKGSEFRFIGPYGKFLLPENTDSDLCFIGTGTGVAPLRSMIHQIMKAGLPYKSITLAFGCRTDQDILYMDEFTALARENPRFRFVPTLSRASDHWQGERGYVHEVYMKAFADGRPAQFFICGLNKMISQCRENLAGLGYDKSVIHFEKYD